MAPSGARLTVRLKLFSMSLMNHLYCSELLPVWGVGVVEKTVMSQRTKAISQVVPAGPSSQPLCFQKATCSIAAIHATVVLVKQCDRTVRHVVAALQEGKSPRHWAVRKCIK